MVILKIKNLLEESINYGDTPLHASLRFQHFDVAKSIIKIISSDPTLAKVVNLLNSQKKVGI